MNKKQIELRGKILKSLERRKNEIYAEMQKKLCDVDIRLMKVKKGEYKLWGKVPKNQRKPLMDMGICLYEIDGKGGDVASWDVEE